MSLRITIEKTIPNMIVHWVDDGEIWASSNYTLLRSKDGAETFQKIIDLEVPFLLRGLGKCRLTTRALRLGIRAMRKLNSGTILIAANRRLFRITNDRIEVTHTFKKGFGPMREGWCEENKGDCYLAEYFLNNKRTDGSVLLKSTDDGRSWVVVHSVQGVRHIHCVQYDPYSKAVWMATGDRDNESHISFSKDGGKSWSTIGSGDQMFRACSLLFTKDYVYWGGDAPTMQNYINRYNRRNSEIESLKAVQGTVLYSTILENGLMLFGTTDEGNSEGKNPTSDRKAHIWASQDGSHWEDIICWGKDSWPYILGYGRVLFAHGGCEQHLYFTTEALRGVDGVLSRAKVSIEV